MSAMAFLAGMGAGINKKERQDKEDARQAKRDARDDEIYNEQKADRAQQRSDRDALRTAGAPIPVTEEGGMPESMDARDIGLPGEAPVAPQTFKAGANSFASRGLAEADAQKQVRGRVASTMAAQGNVLGADQLRTSGLQSEAAQLALDTHKSDEASKRFDDGLNKAAAKSWDELGAFMDNSGASPTKGKWIASADGKTMRAHKMGPDGTLTPTGAVFDNSDKGRMNAAVYFSQRMSPQDKLKHAMAEAEAERRIEHDKATLKIQQQQANTQEQYRRDQAANMRAQRELQAAHDKAVAAGKVKAGDPLQVTLKDKRDFESDLSGHIKDQFPVKDGADPAERAAMSAQATQKRSLGNTLFENNARIGVPLTAGTVMQAMDLAADRKNIRVIKDASGNAYEGVVVNGQAIITGPAMQKKAPTAPGVTPPGPPAPTNPAAAARQGVTPIPTPATPAGPPPEKVQIMAPLNAAVAQLSQQMAAVAQSGDPQAIAAYAPKLEAARAARRQEAIRQFGPKEAEQYLSTLPQ